MTLKELHQLIDLMKRTDTAEREYMLDRFYTRTEISAGLKRAYEKHAAKMSEKTEHASAAADMEMKP